MKAHSELELIARRYRKYGVTLDKLLDLLASARSQGLPTAGRLPGCGSPWAMSLEKRNISAPSKSQP